MLLVVSGFRRMRIPMPTGLARISLRETTEDSSDQIVNNDIRLSQILEGLYFANRHLKRGAIYENTHGIASLA